MSQFSPQDEAKRRVPAFLLRAFWDELDKRGVSQAELERASGVSRPRTGDCTTTIPATDMYRLFEVSRELSGDQVIGLTAGRAIGAAGFHLIGHLVLASANLAQAVELAARVQPQIRSRSPRLEDLGDGALRIGIACLTADNSLGARVEAELAGVLLHDVVLQFFTDAAHARPLVEFPFAAPADTQPYRRMFPGGVRFAGEGTFVYFPGSALTQHKSGADSKLLDHLYNLALDQYGASNTDDNWTERVRSLLSSQTTLLLTEANVLASQLGVTARGLARRLAREGSSLKALLDEALYARAQTLLRRPDATAAQVAHTLGYAELSSFFRAFRRWSGGSTPNAYRRAALS